MPVPKTKPEMTRPPDMTSSIAMSSATRSGLPCVLRMLPITPMRMRSVVRGDPGRRDVRVRHRAVRGLVVLVGEHAVEAELLGGDVHLEVVLVALVPELRVVVRVREHDPARLDLLARRDVRVRHEVDRVELEVVHAATPPMKPRMTSAARSGSCMISPCPVPGAPLEPRVRQELGPAGGVGVRDEPVLVRPITRAGHVTRGAGGRASVVPRVPGEPGERRRLAVAPDAVSRSSGRAGTPGSPRRCR